MTPVWLALVLIVAATLSPGQWTEFGVRPGGTGVLADIILNLVLFVPLGVALGRWGRSMVSALLIGGLLAGSVELAQLVVPGRVASLRDIVVDVAGTLAGWLLWQLLRAYFPAGLPHAKSGP